MKKIILLTFIFITLITYQLKADSDILLNYSNIAEAKYKDALTLAKKMHRTFLFPRYFCFGTEFFIEYW